LRNLLALVISEQEIEASVNADKPFIYEIPIDYDAEVINDSIAIDGKLASIDILIKIKNNIFCEEGGLRP
jgi:hypothetical protein